MRCPECRKDNSDNARFCLRCGTGLVPLCPRCGVELPPDPDLAYCPACGAQIGAPPLTRPPLKTESDADRLKRLVPAEYAERLLATRGQVSAERRMITLLFSDVKGSTAMAEGLDPEDVMEIMDGAFDALIEPVYRYEGTLARLMGDAVLAFFGAPIAHEDDAERACRAALEIVDRAQDYSAKLERARGIRGFDVRVGINTGLVVVGEVGSDLRVEYTAMGDAVNLAARMESAAAPGMVLISEATHRLVAPLFETEALGPLEAKGKAQQVAVYRVLKPKDVRDKVRGIAGLASPLVGREDELSALGETIERLKNGVGGIVTVVGEAGIGKSRLVAELRKGTTASTSPLAWVDGRCLSYGTSIAYQLWLDVLRRLLGVSAKDGPATVRAALRELTATLCPDEGDELLAYLARMMSLPLQPEEEATLRDLEGGQLKARTFRAAETLLASAARNRPLVLELEDLHWADPTSLELLQHLLPLTDRTSLLFICVFRPRREHACWQIRELAAREYPHRHSDVWLEPLSTSQSGRLLSNLLRSEAIPTWFTEEILSVTEGNPFYVEEVLHGLIDQGVVTAGDAAGHWRVAETATTVRLPGTLQAALLARIDRLQEDARRVLQMAAVIGRIFSYQILEAIASGQQNLDQRLLTLQREGMIRELARVPELEYIFKHELTREAAYHGLLRKERRDLHRQVAEALERLFPDRAEEQVGLLAYHWEQAGDAEKAADCLLKAGDQARLAYAHQEAVDYYQRALVYLKEGEEHERAARTLMKLGLAHHNAFEFHQARAVYEKGFAQWQKAARLRDEAPPPPAARALRVGVGEFRTLDVSLTVGLSAFRLIEQLFSGLVELTPETSVVPDVAQSWDVKSGGRKYVFYLRDDVCWSDGVLVTAADFEFSWKRALDPAIDSPNAHLLYDIKGARAYHQGQIKDPDNVAIRALNKRTLAVELEGPTGYFLHLLAYRATCPLPWHALLRHGEAWTEVGNFVSNGPFRLEAWQPGETVVLARNPRYHGHFRGNLRQVVFRMLTGGEDHVTQGLQLYQAGNLDLFQFTSPPQADVLIRQRHAGEYISFPLANTFYVGFVVRRPPFDDLRVRQAFALATDRAKLADVALLGYLFPAAGGFLPPGIPGHSPGIGLPHNPVQARQLLDDAGYAGGRGFPALTMLGPGSAPRYLQESLRAQWRENLGIEIGWEGVGWPELWDRQREDDHALHLDGWIGDLPDPDNFLRVAVQWQVAESTGWRHQAYDHLVEEARRVMDQAERMRLYRRAEQILAEQAPIVPVSYGRRQGLVKPWVKQLSGTAVGWFSLKDVVFEPH